MTKINNKKLKLYEKIMLISLITGSGLSFHKVYLYHLFLIFNFFVFVSWTVKNNFKLDTKVIKENKVMLIFFTYSLLHIFFAKDYILGIKNQIYIICGINVFYAIKILLKKNENEVLKLMKIIFIFSCFIGILEVFHIFRWYTSPYKLSLSIPSVFYGNTNNYATVLIGVFPFILFMKKSLKKIILLIIVIFLLISCSSRTNNIAIMIEVFLFFCLVLYKSNAYKRIFLTITGFVVAFFMRERVYQKFFLLYELFNVSSKRMDSVGVRKMLILNLISELKKVEVFLFGIGGGNAAVIHKIKTGELMSSHSFFLELLVEYGIFIFIMLVSYYLILIYKNLKLYIKTDNKINGSLFISLVGFAIGLNSISTVIYFFPFWVLLGIADFYIKRRN